MSKGNTTFGFELAPRPNRFGFYPIVLRITRDRKKKRVNTGLEVKKQTGIRKPRITSTSEAAIIMLKQVMIY